MAKTQLPAAPKTRHGDVAHPGTPGVGPSLKPALAQQLPLGPERGGKSVAPSWAGGARPRGPPPPGVATPPLAPSRHHAGSGQSAPTAPIGSKLCLRDLLRAAQNMLAAGETQSNILKWVYGVADSHNIRVRVEMVGTVSTQSVNTVSVSNAQIADSSSAPITAPVGPVGAESSSAPTAADNGKAEAGVACDAIIAPPLGSPAEERPPLGTDAGAGAEGALRLILSCGRRKTPPTRGGLSSECNGVVIDTRTWGPLAIPPRAFGARRNRDIDEGLARGAFDIIPVPDGTVVTLYPWGGVMARGDNRASSLDDNAPPCMSGYWALASSNGYDVSSLRWMGPLTYAEVFAAIAASYTGFIAAAGMSFGNGAIHCANLDRSKCYTVGFRHHNFHPLRWDPQAMWQIQYARVGPSQGGPDFAVASHDDGQGLPGIPWQTPLADGGGHTVATLTASMSTSIDDAKKLAAMWAGGVSPVEIGYGRPNYGYILRAREPPGGASPAPSAPSAPTASTAPTTPTADYIIESPLLILVRSILYRRPPKAARSAVTPEIQLEYNVMRWFLSTAQHDDFVDLFPDRRAQVQSYEAFVAQIVQNVIHIHRQISMGDASRPPAAKTPAMLVAKALLDVIIQHEPDIAAFHTETKSVVRDYVMNADYAALFLKTVNARELPA